MQLASMDFTPLRRLAAKTMAEHQDNELVLQVAGAVETCGGTGRKPIEALQEELAAIRARIVHERVRRLVTTLEKLVENLGSDARR